MTLLQQIRKHGGSAGILAKIDDLRANPVPYTFEKGKIPIEALNQGVFWRDRTGKLYEIEEMHPLHAQNALIKLYGAFESEPDIHPEETALWLALVARATNRG